MLSKKELFNAKNAGRKIEDGATFTVVNVGTFPDVDKDGNPVNVTALQTDTGEIYTSISATIANSIDMLDDIIADEGSVTVQVHANTSNGGRKFYQLQII